MPESKNNFIKAKMNQDLDDRLLPKGEYRVGQNVTISRSDGDDVGTFQNVLGNNSLSDFGLNDIGLESIGFLTNSTSDDVYIFATNYNDSSSDLISNRASSGAHYIIKFNIRTNTTNVLVQGHFLNFSKTHPIYGINLIENLLFWTDNRNQPRKINVETANSDTSYYDREDKISVAKFYPSVPLEFYKEIKLKATNSSSSASSVGGTIIETDSESAAGYLASIGLVVGTPVSLNPTSSSFDIGENIYVTALDIPSTANITINQSATWAVDDIVTFTIYGLKNCGNQFLPTIYTGKLLNGNQATGTYTLETLNGVNPVIDGFAASYADSKLYVASAGSVSEITQNEKFKITSYNSSTRVITILGLAGSLPPDLTNNTVQIYRENPDYDPNFSGDTEFLKDKFIRFSYRYKYVDNEYSLMAPFTQIAFVPENFGSLVLSQEEQSAKSSVLNFFENRVDCVSLFIKTPFESNSLDLTDYAQWRDTIDKLGIKELEILCKFSNESSVKVIDVLDIPYLHSLSRDGFSSYVNYVYRSTKPIKVLAEKESVRVYDKVPIKALAQETSGNRVMYGNYIDKHTSPLTLDYKLSILNKIDLPVSQDKRNLYNHSLKQNRTYQVGIVLSDRYGRQSDVILSSIQNSIELSGAKYGSSTIFNYYSTSSSDPSILNFSGKQLMLYLENEIPETINNSIGYPGLYSLTNPLGWYTYKIVVKQQEQEYYNVYIPGSFRPNDDFNFLNSYFSLVNDNINKVPKDLSNVGPEEKEFRSSVGLFSRVNPTLRTINSVPDNTSYFVNAVNKREEVNSIIYNSYEKTTNNTQTTEGREVDPSKVYKGNVSTLANVNNNELFGLSASETPTFNTLGVYETNPFVSNLDIYYETSTSGFISELNTSIVTGTFGPVSLNPIYNLEIVENTEQYEQGTGTVSNPQFGTIIYLVEVRDYQNISILSANNTCSITSAFSTDSLLDISSNFKVVPQVDSNTGLNTGRFNVYIDDVYFYVGFNRSFTLNFSITANNITNNNLSISGAESNIQPQYAQQANIGNTQLGNNYIPISLEPYKDYSRMTGGSTPVSIKPKDYNSPNSGDNASNQGLNPIQAQNLSTLSTNLPYGSIPFLYCMNANLDNAPIVSGTNNVVFPNYALFSGIDISYIGLPTDPPYNSSVTAAQAEVALSWSLAANNGNASLDSPVSTPLNFYCPYLRYGGINDYYYEGARDPQYNTVDSNKYSGAFWWRKLLMNNTDSSFDPSNYPFQRIVSSIPPARTAFIPNRRFPADQISEQSKFYSLVGYISNSGQDGPWNILEKNNLLSRFINNNGGTGFLNGTLNTSFYEAGLTYSISDLHFPTGDILDDPFNPTGRFTDSNNQISLGLQQCVSINSSGDLNIDDGKFLNFFGIQGSLTSNIQDTFGNSVGGIILNNKLGHGNLYTIFPRNYQEGGQSSPWLTSGTYYLGSYGMFWIGFTLTTTDSFGQSTSIPINLLTIV